MRSFLHGVALLVVALVVCVQYVGAVHPVEVRGQDFVDSVTGKRVMLIGVDYQPGGQAGYKPTSGQDPLSNGTVCLRDAALLQGLGVNVIRVYNVDPTINHDECASIFNAVGIYMVIDVNSPFGGESINRANPVESYHVGYLNRIFGVVENFKNYPNLMAFFAANEVINDVGTAKKPPPYIRAVQRDLKNYIAKHSKRTIPVGYSAADVREVLEDSWAYLQCAIDGDENDQSRSDFFGLNSYSWCGEDATYQTAGYDVLVNMFKNSTIPVFFSEYGCNKPEGVARPFNEVQALYGVDMTSLSGGLVYEYSQEESDYGLVYINDNTTVTLKKDFDNLQSQYNKLDIGLVQSTNATATKLTPPECSSALISNSGFSKDFDIPSPPEGAEDLINDGIKSPLNGKLVEVKETNVPMPAYGSTGIQIQNLAIRPLPNDDSNTPNGDTTSPTGSTTAAAASPSATKKGDAGKASIGGFGVAIFAGLVILTML
ncbi:glycoside hydrolase family 72 protein [Amniculicola lignicola CBS 123094]|uniref:1,3-beta-glucanosyltransferase n=1 Tax=Amniculicola lignicola CBS 123094 TaxID=1392246 RepID=A0A6A5VU11_9PLEO|nr:glycoside hydrolase family 72 protein [Amniculicola lignicola CBS 123094]